MLIDLGDVVANADQRSEWNRARLEEMTLIDMDGNRIEVTEEEAKEWAYIGLSNFDFLIKKLNETST